MFRTVPLSIIRSFFTVHTAMVYVIQVCCVYSEKLLMMDSGAVRNMQSFIPKINLRNQCIQLVLLQEFNTTHGHLNVKLCHLKFPAFEFFFICQKRNNSELLPYKKTSRKASLSQYSPCKNALGTELLLHQFLTTSPGKVQWATSQLGRFTLGK